MPASFCVRAWLCGNNSVRFRALGIAHVAKHELSLAMRARPQRLAFRLTPVFNALEFQLHLALTNLVTSTHVSITYHSCVIYAHLTPLPLLCDVPTQAAPLLRHHRLLPRPCGWHLRRLPV